MSTFYCRLAKEQTKHVYQLLKQGKSEMVNIHHNDTQYTIGFDGQFIHSNMLENVLNEEAPQDKEQCILMLYEKLRSKIKDYISEDSFLFIDDQESVFIYSDTPLYYQREEEGEIYISSEKTYLKEKRIYQTDANPCLLYFNNNLKTLG